MSRHIHFHSRSSEEEIPYQRPARVPRTTGTSNFRRALTGNKPSSVPPQALPAHTYTRPSTFQQLGKAHQRPVNLGRAEEDQFEKQLESPAEAAQVTWKEADSLKMVVDRLVKRSRSSSQSSTSSLEPITRPPRNATFQQLGKTYERPIKLGPAGKDQFEEVRESWQESSRLTWGKREKVKTDMNGDAERIRSSSQSFPPSSEQVPIAGQHRDISVSSGSSEAAPTRGRLNNNTTVDSSARPPISRRPFTYIATDLSEQPATTQRLERDSESYSPSEQAQISPPPVDSYNPSRRMSEELNSGFQSIRDAERMLSKVESQAMALADDSTTSNNTTTTKLTEASWDYLTLKIPWPRKPLIWTQDPTKRFGFTFTWLGLILATLAIWFFTESVTCEIFCHPKVSASPYWSIHDPFFPWAIPTKLDQWSGKILSRILEAAWKAAWMDDGKAVVKRGKRVIYY